MLYFRQIVIMLVSLYTVRIVLETLGTEDYGIYNIVGGVVVLFTFLNSAMTSATQRFLNFAMGRGDTEQARDVYSTSLVIHAAIAVVVVVLAETIGLWFFNTWLNIPAERQEAAFAVYQFSVATTVIGILQVPYRATVIAHEKMSFFAMLSIVEAVLKLGVVFLLPVILSDHLVVYAFLVFVTGIVVLLIHKVYCNKVFETARFRFCKDMDLFKRLLGFSGWSVFGGAANLGRDQGTNILLNIFHGVTVNAAMGIATQVNSAVYQFVGNFQTAFNPQIVKSYSAGEHDYFRQLIFRTSKMSFCLLLFFALPLYVNAKFLLEIWLSNVPKYAVVFSQLVIIASLITAITGPLWRAVYAIGDIKKYELIGSCFVFANIPLAFLILWLGFSPIWVLFIKVCLNFTLLIWRVLYIHVKIKNFVTDFICKVIMPILVIGMISGISTVYLQSLFTTGLVRLVASCIASCISIGFLVYFVGLDAQEKAWLKNEMLGKRQQSKIDR